MYSEFISALFENTLQPILHAFGLMAISEQAYQWLWLAGIGVAYMLALMLVVLPLERWRPVEPVTDAAAVRNDIGYTALVQLGLLPLLPAALLVLIFDPLDGAVRSMGFMPVSLEDALPWLAAQPAIAFAIYVLLIDFAMYGLHRAQHIFRPLWELHAIHHSQQQMTFWSDAREHVLSYVFYAFGLACVGLLIGAGRESAFILAGFAVRAVQALSHANVKFSFGATGNRIIVSPQFHRVHHAIGIGHEGKHHGCNFASVFAFWDVLFGTANLRNIYPRTGVRNQLQGADYGETIAAQQWLAIKRILQR
jgi:sterol desaturase/sphingolipid hydroxylase (fatty acid hydroxylase superfamily)